MDVVLQTPLREVNYKIDLDPDEPSQRWMLDHLQRGICYEPEEVQVMLRAIQPGDFVVDIGAHVGFFTCLFASLVGPTGTVLAFEPEAGNFYRLQTNIARNGFTNVVVRNEVLWSKPEDVTFWFNSDTAGGHCVWDPGTWLHGGKSKANPRPSTRRATTLDNELVGLERVKLIKIDTEGADQRILQGAVRTLNWFKPYVITELNPFGSQSLGCSNESFREYMRDFGYDIFLLHSEGKLPSLVPQESEIVHTNGTVVMNAMFSTLKDVAKLWPTVPV